MKKKILLIDDMKNIVLTFKFGLEQAGYEVYTAHDGKKGVEIALQVKPDLIILDNKMPGELSGWEAALKIKTNKETSHIPLIGFTAYTGKKEMESGIQSGLSEIVLKPVYLDDIVTVIKKYLGSN